MTRKAYRKRKRAPRRSDEREKPFYPDHFIRGLMAIAGTVAVVSLLAAAFPPSLDRGADPLTGPDQSTKMAWFLKPTIPSGSSPALRTAISSSLLILAALFVLFPFLDRTRDRRLRKRLLLAVPFFLWMVYLVVAALLPTGGGLP